MDIIGMMDNIIEAAKWEFALWIEKMESYLVRDDGVVCTVEFSTNACDWKLALLGLREVKTSRGLARWHVHYCETCAEHTNGRSPYHAELLLDEWLEDDDFQALWIYEGQEVKHLDLVAPYRIVWPQG